MVGQSQQQPIPEAATTAARYDPPRAQPGAIELLQGADLLRNQQGRGHQRGAHELVNALALHD